jgi:hypothetical protein
MMSLLGEFVMLSCSRVDSANLLVQLLRGGLLYSG